MIRVVPTGRKQQTPPNTLSGRYLLLEEIGRGRTASVHKAWDQKDGREVAVKLPIRPECLLAKEIFDNEMNALERIRHPNIVEMTGSGEYEPGKYIVMELIRGACLRDLIEKKRLDLRSGLKVLAQLSRALADIHRMGIVHRDVKPRNVMVTREGSAKLLDFGYANIERRFCCKHLTKDRFGSPFYSAPELTRHSADPRIDIYSLGMMTFEMLLQNSTFKVVSAIRMLELQHSFGHLKRMVVRGRIPRMAGELVEAAVNRNPDKRSDSIEDFNRMLGQLLDEIERI